MKFGIKTPPQHCTWENMLEIWQAAGLGEAGVDLVIFTMRNPYSVAMLEPLSVALESIGGAI